MRHLTQSELAGLQKLAAAARCAGSNRARADAAAVKGRDPDIELACRWIDDAAEHKGHTIGYCPAPSRGCRECPFGQGQRCWLDDLAIDPFACCVAPCVAPEPIRTVHDGPAPERCPWRLGWTVVMHAAERGATEGL